MRRFLFCLLISFFMPLALIAQSNAMSADTAQATKYIVQKGDNLYRIALNHSVTLNELLDINDFKPGETNIFVGQEILIPPPGSMESEAELVKEQQEMGYYSWKKKQLDAQVEAEEAKKDSLHKEEAALKELMSSTDSASNASPDSGSSSETLEVDPQLAAKLAEIDSLKRMLEQEIAEKEELKRQLTEEQSLVQPNSETEAIEKSAELESDSLYALYEAVDSAGGGRKIADVVLAPTVTEAPVSKKESIVPTDTAKSKAPVKKTALEESIEKAKNKVFDIEDDIKALKQEQQKIESEAQKEANTPVDNDDINAILARMEAAKLRSQREKELEAQLEVKEEELLKAKAEWNVLLRQHEMEVAGLTETKAEIEEHPAAEVSPTDNPPVKAEPEVSTDSVVADSAPVEIHKTKEEDGLVTEMFITGTSLPVEEEPRKKKRDKIKNQPEEPVDFESTVFPVEEVTIAEEKNKPDEIDSTSVIKAEFFLARALNEIDQQNYKAAEKYIDKSLKLNPEYLAAIMLHGDLYSAFGYFDDAEKDYLKVIEKDSLIPQAYYNLAQCLAFRGMDAKAFMNYEKAIDLDDEYILAYSGRAAMFLKSEDYTSAIADYSRILKLNQYFLPAYRGRGFARYKTGSYKSAIKDFNFYLEMESMDSYALYYRGMSQILSNNLYNGCIDLLKSSELGYGEATKALGRYCD